MKKFMKAGLIALSMLVGTAGIAAVAAPHTVSAKKKKPAPKIDAAAFNKMTAALDKASAEVKKQQAALVTKLQKSQADLEKQLQDALTAAAAAAADPNAPAAPVADPAAPAVPAIPAAPAVPAIPAAPAVPAADPGTPADPAAPAVPAEPQVNPPVTGAPDFEVSPALLEMLQKLADQDASVVDLFPARQLDKLSSLADRWLSIQDQLDEFAVTNAVLETKYNAYLKKNKFADALKALSGQVELDKQLNKTYDTLLKLETGVSTAIVEPTDPSSNDDGQQDDEDGDHHDGEHGNHDDGNGDNHDGKRKQRDNHDD